jgi:hypothetical protein
MAFMQHTTLIQLGLAALCLAGALLRAAADDATNFLQWAPTPPLGWNSYDVYGDRVTEAEVLTNVIDQDALGRPAAHAAQVAATEVWVKDLADGSKAVGLFNRGAQAADVTVDWPANRARCLAPQGSGNP